MTTLYIRRTPSDLIPDYVRPVQRTGIVSFQCKGSKIGDTIFTVEADLELTSKNPAAIFVTFNEQVTLPEDKMDPRYPIGKYAQPQDVTPALRQHAISTIAETPAKLRAAVKGLNDQQLNTPYRE